MDEKMLKWKYPTGILLYNILMNQWEFETNERTVIITPWVATSKGALTEILILDDSNSDSIIIEMLEKEPREEWMESVETAEKIQQKTMDEISKLCEFAQKVELERSKRGPSVLHYAQAIMKYFNPKAVHAYWDLGCALTVSRGWKKLKVHYAAPNRFNRYPGTRQVAILD